MRNVNNMKTQNLIFQNTGTDGFIVAWSFIAMFENLTKTVSHTVCLIWKFSRGWLKNSNFTRQHKMVPELLSPLLVNQNTHIIFKEFQILIQYNNSLRVPWKRCAKIEPKSKRGSKES